MPEKTETTVVPLTLLVLLVAYLFVDGIFLYLHTTQLVIYVLFAAATSGAAIFALSSAKLRPRHATIILVWLLAVSAWLLPALVADYPYPRYVLGDFIAVLLPVVLLAVGLRYDSLFLSRNSLVVLGCMMIIAALLAVPLSESAGRHEPPSTLLIAMVWAAYFLSAARAVRLVAVATIAVLIVLAWTSGERTSLLLLLALGIAGRLFLMRRLRNALFLGAALVLSMVAVAMFFSEELILLAASTRLEALTQGELDTSLLNRVLEVSDVWLQWSVDHWYGYGHGATYTPELSNPMRNLTEHARVHHIHFGPMLLLFRYGIPGLMLYIWLVADVLWYTTAMNRIRYQTPDSHFIFFFALALLGYLASFLVFSIIPDPAFSYALAGYLYLRLTRPVPELREIRIRKSGQVL